MKQLATFLLLLAAAGTSAEARSFKPGTILRDAPYAPEMVVLPAGSGLLGSTEAETTREGRPPAQAAWERPQRKVRFARPFAVGKYHVTRAEYDAFVKDSGYDAAGCLVALDGKWGDGPLPDRSYRDVGFAQGDTEPALCANWADANAYAAWLSRKTGQTYRLLTEDEWEYAARGGKSTARWWGDDIKSICQHVNGGDRDYAAKMPSDKTANLACADGFAFTSPGNHFPANPFGLHDMLGNAWQWVANCFAPVPGTTAGGTDCKARSIRGGSWHNGLASLRPATRFSLPPAMRSSSLGFRVMREIH